MPCSDLLLNIFNSIGLKIGEKIGVKNAILLSLALEFISLIILLFIPKYIFMLISMGIFGIGMAMNSIIVTKNGWKYFPHKKGIVSGINLSATGISSSLLTPIADYLIINPKKNKTDSDGLYPKEIANRLPKYLYFLLVIFFIIGSFSYFFTFNYKEENKENISQNENDEKIIDKSCEEKKKEEEKNKIDDEDKKEEKNFLINSNKNQNIISTKELLGLYFSKKNIQFLSISIGGPSKIIIFNKNKINL